MRTLDLKPRQRNQLFLETLLVPSHCLIECPVYPAVSVPTAAIDDPSTILDVVQHVVWLCVAPDDIGIM
jgi:hypothetical protein